MRTLVANNSIDGTVVAKALESSVEIEAREGRIVRIRGSAEGTCSKEALQVESGRGHHLR
jgi:hypothetical protein